MKDGDHQKMQRDNIAQNTRATNIILIITGMGIGWLVGLSVSPVVSIVITSVTGSTAAIVAALSGLNDGENDGAKAENKAKRLRWEVNPTPIAMLVIGLFLGSIAGIWVRTHDLLSPRTSTLTDEIDQWTTAGLEKKDVVNRLFENKYTTSNTNSVGQQNTAPFHASVLFAQEAQEECKTLIILVTKKKYEDLQTEMFSSAIPAFRELPKIITDTVNLAQIVEKVLCGDIQP